jgi:hypothetical protein
MNSGTQSALSEIAVLLKEFFIRLEGRRGVEFLRAFERFLKGENPWPPRWYDKDVEIGEYGTSSSLLRALEDQGIVVSQVARRMFEHIYFSSTGTKTTVHLKCFSVADLGFPYGATFGEICLAAESKGCRPCKYDQCDVGPVLRLAYLDQPPGEEVLIATTPIEAVDEISGFRLSRIFALTREEAGVQHNDVGVRLGATTCASTQVWGPETLFVFVAQS